MKTLLQIKSSIYSEGGQSSQLTDRFVAAWRESNPDGQVRVRDLAREPVPHLDAERFGVTFRYTENGPVGLLTGKKVYAFATRGGMYAGTPRDTQTAFVRNFLAFLGLDDVEFVYAEGLAIGEASKEQALARARAEIDRIAEPRMVAA